ncbi:autotransporter domain-containing protein [Achromobacter xylosoxidans]
MAAPSPCRLERNPTTRGPVGPAIAVLAARLGRGSTTLSAYGAYRYGNPTRLDFTAAFAGAPDASFEVQGIGLPRHTGWLGLGASSQLADDVSWYASYDAQFGPGGLTNNVFAAGLRYRFQ